MKKEELGKIIAQGGATLDKQLQNFENNNGYMVSIYGQEKVFKLDQTSDILKAIDEYKETLKNNEFIGIWIDNGLLYLDKSKHYLKKDKAILTGIKNKQLAIYDLSKNESIYLTKKTYIIYKYNKINNDLQYIKEYFNIDELVNEYKLENKKSIYNFVVQDIEENDYKNLLHNKYIIFIDNVPLNEI